MAIQFMCRCGHWIDTPDHAAGRKGRCPRCLARFVVPVEEARPLVKEERGASAVGEFMELGEGEKLSLVFPQTAESHHGHQSPAGSGALPESAPHAKLRKPRPAFQPFGFLHAWRAKRRAGDKWCAQCGLEVGAGDPTLGCRCGLPELEAPKRASGLEDMSQVDLRIALAFLGGKIVDR